MPLGFFKKTEKYPILTLTIIAISALSFVTYLFNLERHTFTQAIPLFALLIAISVSLRAENIKKQELYIILATLASGMIITICQIYSQNSGTARLWISITLLLLTSLACYRIYPKLKNSRREQLVSLLALLVCAVSIIAAQLIIDGINSPRFKAGVNPNYISFWGILFIIWGQITLQSRIYKKLSIILILMGITIALLTFSRAAVIALASASFLILLSNRHYLITALILILSSLIMVGLLNKSSAERPMSDTYRYNTYQFLFSEFNKAPIFGSAGWRNTTIDLSNRVSQGEVIASSPHNFHLRVLAETGIVGYLAILIPLALLIGNPFSSQPKVSKELIIIRSWLVALLIWDLFEDTFMATTLTTGSLKFYILIGFLCYLRFTPENQPTPTGFQK